MNTGKVAKAAAHKTGFTKGSSMGREPAAHFNISSWFDATALRGKLEAIPFAIAIMSGTTPDVCDANHSPVLPKPVCEPHRRQVGWDNGLEVLNMEYEEYE